MSGTWGGSATRRARAHFLPLLPLPCSRCPFEVYPDQRWHVDHLVERALDGTDDLTNLWPAHARCNEAAGGRLAQARRRRPMPLILQTRRRSWS